MEALRTGFLMLLVAPALALLPGCMAVPCSPGANFGDLGITEASRPMDPAVADRLGRQPAAAFPVVIAAMRIQGPGFRREDRGSMWAPTDGKALIVTVRDVEKQEDFDRLAQLPMVS